MASRGHAARRITAGLPGRVAGPGRALAGAGRAATKGEPAGETTAAKGMPGARATAAMTARRQGRLAVSARLDCVHP